MNAIEQWNDNNSPYLEGVLLYAKFPMHNKILLKNFQKKQSPKLYEKLKYELSKINNFEKPVVKKTIPSKIHQKDSKNDVVHHIEVQQNQHVTKQALYFHELPTELRPALLEANLLFREMCFLKVKLNELPEEAEDTALSIIVELDTKQKRNALCWEKLEYWKQYKIAPVAPKNKFENLTPANQVKREQLLFASISKMKKRLELNRVLLSQTSNLQEHNKLNRSIAKQESALIAKNEELITIKRLINGN